MNNEHKFSRRALLSSLGASAAFLPLLRTTKGWAAPEPAPQRLLVVQWTNGIINDGWKSAIDRDHAKDVIYTKLNITVCANDPNAGAGHQSLPHLLTLLQDLRTRKVGFRSLQEQLDTTTVIEPGDTAEIDAQGNLVISLGR